MFVCFDAKNKATTNAFTKLAPVVLVFYRDYLRISRQKRKRNRTDYIALTHLHDKNAKYGHSLVGTKMGPWFRIVSCPILSAETAQGAWLRILINLFLLRKFLLGTLPEPIPILHTLASQSQLVLPRCSSQVRGFGKNFLIAKQKNQFLPEALYHPVSYHEPQAIRTLDGRHVDGSHS